MGQLVGTVKKKRPNLMVPSENAHLGLRVFEMSPLKTSPTIQVLDHD